MVVILVVGLTHQSLYCTTDMVRRRLWSSAPGSARYFLALGDGWLDEWVTAMFDCGWVDGERGTKNDWRQTSRHDCFVDAISRRVTNVRPRYQTSVAAADTAAPRHIPHGRWAGRNETAISRLRTASHRYVNDRNSGELWFSSACSGQLRRPKHSFQRRRPTRNSSQELRNQSKNYASRSRAWRWANTAVLTETPSSSSILHLSYKPELSYSCLPKNQFIIFTAVIGILHTKVVISNLKPFCMLNFIVYLISELC